MKAIILVGGFGTRLRPLTLSVPKPVVEFCNKPMILYQIEALSKIGVKKIVLAVSRCAEKMEVVESEMKSVADQLKVEIIFSYEETPLGTAGPLALARKHLEVDKSPFFVLNSDIICDFPFESLLEFHNIHGREGTIVVTKVDEPSKYGVIVYDETSKMVKRFVEKPQEYVSNKINAGIYILNVAVLDRIELKLTSIENEVFPKMVTDEQLFCIEMKGFWMDIGQPKDYIKGVKLYLENVAKKENTLAKGPHIIGNVLIHPTAKISSKCQLGPDVVIGENVTVQDGVRIRSSTIFKNSLIKSHSWIDSTLVGWNCEVGQWVRLENFSVLGDDVRIKNELYVNGGRILPHKSISESVPEETVIM